MSAPPIRPIAICIVWRNDEPLVFEGRDEHRDLTFYRPLGGAIEFGERSEDAVRRELREEIGAELEDVRLLTVSENVFTFQGTRPTKSCSSTKPASRITLSMSAIRSA